MSSKLVKGDVEDDDVLFTIIVHHPVLSVKSVIWNNKN